MNFRLRILHVEDNVADAELTRDLLETDGIACDLTRVETESGLLTALRQGEFDLVLADYSLPSFDGESALRIVREQRPDLPFIFVSGTMGEEVAIDALKLGATDYVLKTRTSRLVPAVHRALREASERSELQRAEHELRERESKIRRLVDANIIGILISDLRGRIIEANDAFLQIVGYTQNDVREGRLHRLEITPPEWQAASERAAAQLTAKGVCELFEKEYIRRDGTRVPVLVAAAAIEGTKGENVAFVLDLTERKRAEQEREKLVQLQAELAYMSRVITAGEFAASLAHEINQPIAGAVTNAQACTRWLRREAPEIEKACEAATRMVRDVTRAVEIVERVRSLYRRDTPQRQAVDLNEAIRQIVVLLKDRANQHSISIRTELDPELPLVSADRVQLQQVLMNLMLNGIDAMKNASGELKVVSRKTADGQLLISVSDSGVGLPVENTERIFDAFFTTKPQGTGMGLAISRRIVESFGGRLWASANIGPGATFYFTLPADCASSSRSDPAT
jgi:PAS domain S-box-containing protein